MDTPPAVPPDSKPPLGRGFTITLLAPVVAMGIGAAASGLSERDSELQGFGMMLGLLTLPAMLACSIICAVKVGRRSGGGMGFLSFLGIQVLYIAVAFGGCAVTMSHMDFR